MAENTSYSDALKMGTKRKTSSPLQSAPKEPNMDIEDDIPDSIRDEISDQLERIRSLNVNNESNVPNGPRLNTRPSYRTASEASFGSSWDKGLTDVVQIELLTLNGQAFNVSIARPEIVYIWNDI